MCNFKPNIPDLQPVADDTVREGAKLQPPSSTAIWTSDGSTFYSLNSKCQDFVDRYLGRSLINTDDPRMTEVNRKLLTIAFTVSLVNDFSFFERS